MLKKFTVGSWLTLIAAIAGVVGVIFMLRSSNIDTAYAYKTLTDIQWGRVKDPYGWSVEIGHM